MFIIHLKVINIIVTSALYSSGGQPDDPMEKIQKDSKWSWRLTFNTVSTICGLQRKRELSFFNADFSPTTQI